MIVGREVLVWAFILWSVFHIISSFQSRMNFSWSLCLPFKDTCTHSLHTRRGCTRTLWRKTQVTGETGRGKLSSVLSLLLFFLAALRLPCWGQALSRAVSGGCSRHGARSNFYDFLRTHKFLIHVEYIFVLAWSEDLYFFPSYIYWLWPVVLAPFI